MAPRVDESHLGELPSTVTKVRNKPVSYGASELSGLCATAAGTAWYRVPLPLSYSSELIRGGGKPFCQILPQLFILKHVKTYRKAERIKQWPFRYPSSGLTGCLFFAIFSVSFPFSYLFFSSSEPLQISHRHQDL